tara:strand:- start:1298 stop:1594 length:297 start_codon:yes stop_codon:yes gene_type:complete
LFQVFTAKQPVFSRFALPETTLVRKVRLRVAALRWLSSPYRPGTARHRPRINLYRHSMPKITLPRAPLPKMILEQEIKPISKIPKHRPFFRVVSFFSW